MSDRGSPVCLSGLGQSPTGPGLHLMGTADSGEAGRDYSRDQRVLLLTGQERVRGCRQAEVFGSVQGALAWRL